MKLRLEQFLDAQKPGTRRVSAGDQSNPTSSRGLMLISDGFPMIEVSIPSMERRLDESGKCKKVRQVTCRKQSGLGLGVSRDLPTDSSGSRDLLLQIPLFRVEVLFNERKHFVLRRNSEFHTLHRKLRKIIQTPDFPSKRNPHLRTKPPEQRRQELEDYIQDIIYRNEDVPQELLDFLHVKHFHTGNRMSSIESLDDLDSQEEGFQFPHQRVLGYFQDPFLSDCTKDLPDVVVDGVLQGFYPRDVRVSFSPSLNPSPL